MHTKFWLERLKKRATGRYKRRWEENFRLDLRETEWKGVDWMHLAQDRDQWRALANTGSIRSGGFIDCVTISFSRWTLLY
jgi:hypothetical protein